MNPSDLPASPADLPVPPADLPAPPADRAGWPWTTAPSALPATMPDGQAWPRISIVTPSFNQGRFLEETIRSVLLQNYPNLEFIVIDGGSQDESVEVIRKYERWLAHWESEPDRGQVHAINKGLSRCSGEIFNWINSDDLLLPGALAQIARAAAGCDAVGAGVINFWEEAGHEEAGKARDEERIFNARLTPVGLARMEGATQFHQPGVWLRPNLIARCGGIDERYHFAFDWDLAIRYFNLFPNVAYLDAPVARFRLHPASKTLSAQQKFGRERILILDKLRRSPALASHRRALSYCLRLARWWKIMNTATAWPRQPRAGQTLRLMRLACNDPLVRWSRKTLGCLRRVLLARP